MGCFPLSSGASPLFPGLCTSLSIIFVLVFTTLTSMFLKNKKDKKGVSHSAISPWSITIVAEEYLKFHQKIDCSMVYLFTLLSNTNDPFTPRRSIRLFPDFMNELTTFVSANEAIRQGQVVQKVDATIHRINHYPVDSVVCFVNTYRLDSDLSAFKSVDKTAMRERFNNSYSRSFSLSLWTLAYDHSHESY